MRYFLSASETCIAFSVNSYFSRKSLFLGPSRLEWLREFSPIGLCVNEDCQLKKQMILTFVRMKESFVYSCTCHDNIKTPSGQIRTSKIEFRIHVHITLVMGKLVDAKSKVYLFFSFLFFSKFSWGFAHQACHKTTNSSKQEDDDMAMVPSGGVALLISAHEAKLGLMKQICYTFMHVSEQVISPRARGLWRNTEH